jgi:hypothetical protein
VTSRIRDIALDGHRDAITIRPNPATDVVHIAWRGDLSRTPARFEVYDLLGRLVAQGEAAAGRARSSGGVTGGRAASTSCTSLVGSAPSRRRRSTSNERCSSANRLVRSTSFRFTPVEHHTPEE